MGRSGYCLGERGGGCRLGWESVKMERGNARNSAKKYHSRTTSVGGGAVLPGCLNVEGRETESRCLLWAETCATHLTRERGWECKPQPPCADPVSHAHDPPPDLRMCLSYLVPPSSQVHFSRAPLARAATPVPLDGAPGVRVSLYVSARPSPLLDAKGGGRNPDAALNRSLRQSDAIPGTSQSGARCCKARAGSGGSRGRHCSRCRSRECKLEPARPLDDPGRGPFCVPSDRSREREADGGRG